VELHLVDCVHESQSRFQWGYTRLSTMTCGAEILYFLMSDGFEKCLMVTGGLVTVKLSLERALVGNEGLVAIGDARSEQSRHGGKNTRGEKKLRQALYEAESTVTGMHLRDGIL
jgi:hypothetical protein